MLFLGGQSRPHPKGGGGRSQHPPKFWGHLRTPKRFDLDSTRRRRGPCSVYTLHAIGVTTGRNTGVNTDQPVYMQLKADSGYTTTIRLRFDRVASIRRPTSRKYVYLCARAAALRPKRHATL